MKVLSREAFLKMPAGTIFAKGQPWAFVGVPRDGNYDDA